MKSRVLLLCATALLSSSQFTSAATIAGSYYEESGAANCSATFCTLVFPAFPAALNGQFVNLTELSCSTYSSNGLASAQLLVSDNGVNLRRPHHIAVDHSAEGSAFSAQLDFKVTGGPPRQMVLSFYSNTTGTINAICTLVGRISSS